MGVHSTYNLEIVDRICFEISNGANLNKLCELDDVPDQATIYRWFLKEPDFCEKYARARSLRAGVRSDRVDDYCKMVLGGKLDANAARVIIDAEKWQAAHEAPKVFGDRIENRHSGPEGEPLKIVVTGIRPTEENT